MSVKGSLPANCRTCELSFLRGGGGQAVMSSRAHISESEYAAFLRDNTAKGRRAQAAIAVADMTRPALLGFS